MSEIENFDQNHHRDSYLDSDPVDTIGNINFVSTDGKIGVMTEGRILVSITFYSEFEVPENIIGRQFDEACQCIIDGGHAENLRYVFGPQIEYDDGRIEMNVDFDSLGLYLVITLSGRVVSAAIIPNTAVCEQL